MTVATPRWRRTLELQAWIERPRRSFIRILAPAKEAGIASLRIGAEMWNYLPAVERTIKIPPSMMMQPWMGSDFTNDDLVKESSLIDDYARRIIATDTVGGTATYVVESMPKPDAAVVWGRIVLRVRKADFLPVREDHRSHIRGIVIDATVGYTGGFGFDDKWLGGGRRLGEWRETNARFEGPVTAQLQATFVAARRVSAAVVVDASSRAWRERPRRFALGLWPTHVRAASYWRHQLR